MVVEPGGLEGHQAGEFDLAQEVDAVGLTDGESLADDPRNGAPVGIPQLPGDVVHLPSGDP